MVKINAEVSVKAELATKGGDFQFDGNVDNLLVAMFEDEAVMA